MSHKEKKKLKKQQEYEKQMEMLTKKGGQGHSDLDANFTVSQAQKTAGECFNTLILLYKTYSFSFLYHKMAISQFY